MANEELEQRGYFVEGKLRGDKFGPFECFNVGCTSIKEFVASGITATVPATLSFPFKAFKPPRLPTSAKPDTLYIQRLSALLRPVAIAEHKSPKRRRSERDILCAAEQALFSALALDAQIALIYRNNGCLYVDVAASALKEEIVYFAERRDFNPAVLQNLLLKRLL
jgi:hypothetical protein